MPSETDRLLPVVSEDKNDKHGDDYVHLTEDAEAERRITDAESPVEEEEEVFATIRILSAEEAPSVPLHDVRSMLDSLNSTFLDDLKNFTPGSMPHSTIVGICIGVFCGVLSFLYYTVLQFLLKFLWKTLPDIIVRPYLPEEWYWVWIPGLGFMMALGVGASVQFLGEPGDLSYTVQCVHDKAYIGMDHVLPMLVSSQFSILGGASVGPEAPLVALCASFSGYISRKIFKMTNMNLIRKHTLMGMACALAAFFGTPLGGSLFALEINNRFGIEYYEHTMEAIFSGTVCVCVFRAIAGLDMGAIWRIEQPSWVGDHIPTDTSQMSELGRIQALAPATPQVVVLGAGLGLLGAAIAAMFATFHKYNKSLFVNAGLLNPSRIIPRAFAGASVMLLIGILCPRTMFWGELEFQIIATGAPAEQLPHVFPTAGLLKLQMHTARSALSIGILKLIAISFSVAAGYRGGFIFPFFAAGAAFGKALSFAVPSLPPTLTTLCFAAAINVAITRTCLATTLILCALAGESNAISPVLAASMVSLFATSYMPFIRSQVRRRDVEHSQSYIS